MGRPDNFAQADAEWDVLPGTPPDGWSYISESDLGDNPEFAFSIMQARLDAWCPEMTFYRATRVTEESHPGIPAGMWLEVWKTRPDKQAEFNPPLTVGSQQTTEAYCEKAP